MVNNWRYYNDTSTQTWTDSGTATCTNQAYAVRFITTVGTANTTEWTYHSPPPRKILIEAPEHWNDETRRAFTRLVNEETKTGWLIEMWIDGRIEIVDPEIDVRSMANFWPLLKKHANAEDRARIDAFFQANLEPEAAQ